jgi:hypothetical protein
LNFPFSISRSRRADRVGDHFAYVCGRSLKAFISGKLICRKRSKFLFSANLLTKFHGQFRESHCKKGQRMWLDLLVASGLGLPALIYGSLLFVHYMQ